MNFTYVQGKLRPTQDLEPISYSRAYKYGDAVFESLRIKNSKIFNLPFHIFRLQTGLSDLKINFDISEFEKLCRMAIAQTGLENGYLRVQICRSGISKGYLPLEDTSIAIVEIINGLKDVPDTRLHVYSGKAHLLSKAKTSNALNYVLASMEAAENSCDNSIILSPEGYICESSNANIFWVKNDHLYTPALQLPLIPGSVQDVILRNFDATEAMATLPELANACEIFVTNTTTILQNVIYINTVTLNLTSSSWGTKIKKMVQKNSNFS